MFNWLYVKKNVNCLIARSKNKIVGIYLFTPLNQFDKKLSSDMGEKSKRWFDKYVVGEGLVKIINAIESENQT